MCALSLWNGTNSWNVDDYYYYYFAFLSLSLCVYVQYSDFCVNWCNTYGDIVFLTMCHIKACFHIERKNSCTMYYIVLQAFPWLFIYLLQSCSSSSSSFFVYFKLIEYRRALAQRQHIFRCLYTFSSLLKHFEYWIFMFVCILMLCLLVLDFIPRMICDYYIHQYIRVEQHSWERERKKEKNNLLYDIMPFLWTITIFW